MTSKSEIESWIEHAPEGTRWMLVICDTYDYEDYPAYFSDPNKCMKKIQAATAGENMMSLMECYDLSLDVNSQLREFRANHFPTV